MTKPRILVLADLTKPAVGGALAIVKRCLKGRATLLLRDLSERVEDERVSARFGLVLGGDGAILAAARRVGRAGVPLVGVNLGKLGFLTEIGPEDLEASIEKLLRRLPPQVERLTLEARLKRRGKLIRRCCAVNDVVVSREALSRIIELTLFINGEKVNTFAADGIICSTPVGSTAHSLAAGGPILEPGMEAIIISPICPHTLSNRPLVIDAASRIELEVSSRSVALAMTVDGQVVVDLRNGDRIAIRRNRWPLRLLRVAGRSFFDTLHTKLSWEGSTRHA